MEHLLCAGARMVMMFKVPALMDFIIYSSWVHKKSTYVMKNKIISSNVECFEENKG